ncbi:hypothetical protein ACFV98_35555 [Streptomyces violascens]|uniref:hypothetical protein n=1 Tax=Streptomyces violascens TaxID=67381 RepID=UPI003656DCDB
MPTTQTFPHDYWTDIPAELAQRVPLPHPSNTGLVNATQISTLAPAHAGAPAAQGTGGVTVRALWWGFHLEIDHSALESILTSADAVNSLVGMIGGTIPSPAQPWLVLAAQFVAGAHQLLRSLDWGKGIYISAPKATSEQRARLFARSGSQRSGSKGSGSGAVALTKAGTTTRASTTGRHGWHHTMRRGRSNTPASAGEWPSVVRFGHGI